MPGDDALFAVTAHAALHRSVNASVRLDKVGQQ
jgi:hypothetical protein